MAPPHASSARTALPERRRAAPEEPARPALPIPPDHPLIALQRSAGNAAVSRMLGATALLRQPAGTVAPAVDPALAAFMAMSYIAKDVHPSTGRGLFDAAYEPTTGEMAITVRVHFNFQAGNILDPDWLAGIGGFPALLTSGWTASDFIWTDDEKAAWAKNAISEVQDLWSEQYVFFNQTPGWESLPAVHVNVVIQEGPPDKSQWVIDVNKWPTDAGLEESMDIPGAADRQSHGRLQEMTRDPGGITDPDSEHRTRGTGARARYGQVDTDNPGIVLFDKGVSAVSAADATVLQNFGATLGAPDIPPFPVELTGRASAEGEEARNMTLSADRARNVANEIVNGGAKTQPTEIPKGEEGAADNDPAWRRVEIVVKDFEADQTTVKHEFGHILGLGDEYPIADPALPTSIPDIARWFKEVSEGRVVGAPVAHSGLAQRLIPGQQPIVAHHDESIMSNGEQVRPYHYVTFLEALGNMTGTAGQWGIRPGPGPGGRGPGDFPLPPADGTRVA
jgi:outer membrane protein OmpA-like peptidoglycan-associated protein